MRFQAPRGTEDVLPSQSGRWRRLEEAFRELCRLYGYEEIRTPTFEEYELFVRSSGDTSEVVSKQMYDFIDKGGRHIALKPEGTAPAMRALIEHSLCPQGAIARLYYITPVFRYERPQKGRLREPHQVGIELVGSASPDADAEVIEFSVRFYESLGLGGIRVKLNSIGRETCRAAYREALLAFARPHIAQMSTEFQQSAERNPLRLLDTKDESLKGAMAKAPNILDFLEPESNSRLVELQRLLRSAGVAFDVDPGIVRGLDYYTETVFEIHSDLLGSQSTLCGGGRYDGLVKEMGGADTPAVGVAMGIERALIVLDGIDIVPPSQVDVFVVAQDDAARDKAREIVRDLRVKGASTLYDLDARSLRSQMNQSNKAGARWTFILGEEELGAQAVTVKDMEDGSQRSVPWAELSETDWRRGA